MFRVPGARRYCASALERAARLHLPHGRIVGSPHKNALRSLGEDFAVDFAGFSDFDPVGVCLEGLPTLVGRTLTFGGEDVDQCAVLSCVIGGDPIHLVLHPMLLEELQRVPRKPLVERWKASRQRGVRSQLVNPDVRVLVLTFRNPGSKHLEIQRQHDHNAPHSPIRIHGLELPDFKSEHLLMSPHR